MSIFKQKKKSVYPYGNGTDSYEEEAQKEPVYKKNFHNYFEGYTEYVETTEDGKDHRRLVYTEPYRQACLTPGQRVWLRLLYAACAAVSAGMFVMASSRHLPSNYGMIAVILTAISLGSFVYFGIYLASYIIAPSRMIIRQYRNIEKMTLAAKICAGIDAVCALSALIYAFLYIHFTEYFLSELLCALLFAGAGAALVLIAAAEKKISYEEVANPVRVDAEDAVLIQRII